jgi:tetratricopeptide (TPR) repeat protein
MFSLLSCIVLLVLAALSVDAATLKGVITANELTGQGSDNVQVTVDEGGSNSTVSKDGGKFTFVFPEKQAGETVHIRVNKEGCVVVNDVQLELALPANADAKLVIIILCRQTDREEMARRFYRLKSFEAIEETYQKNVMELKEAREADATVLAKLQQQRDQAKAAVEKAAEELAKNQPGQSSDFYRQAKRLFLDGKIDEAIKLLDDEELRRSMARAQQAKAEAEKAIEDAIHSWLLKAQLLTIRFRFAEAETEYLAAIDAAPDRFETHFTYADFSVELDHEEQADTAYRWCLEWAKKAERFAELAQTLNNLGVLHNEQNRMEESGKEFDEALKLRRDLTQKNPEVYLPDLAQTLNNLGLFNLKQDRSAGP